MKHKLLSVLLTLCLAFSLLPTAALAEEGEAARTGDLTYTTADETISGFTYTSGTITINAENVTVENVTFGDGARLEVNTPGRFTLKNCTFNGKTEVRTPVTLNVGSATVTGNTFNGTKEDGTPSYYNAIEFAVSSGNKLSSATLSNNIFEAAIKNNYFSTYYYADNAVITAENNVIKLANRGSNAIRISNVTNSNVTFNLNNNSYEFSDASGSSEYEGFIILQDFTKKSGNTEDFSKVTINISNLTSPSDASRLFYVWEDSVGLVSDNNPVIKGDSSIEKFFTAKVGDTYYKTLPEAVAAAQNGETVTLLKDVTTKVTILAGKTVTLDLDGKKLTVPTDVGILVKGKLTVTGNGTVTCDRTPFMVDAGELVIENGTVNSDNDYGIYAKNGGRITVNGGTLTSLYSPLTGNNTTGNMNFTVNGGTLTAKSGPAIYMPGQVSLTITDGVLNGGISLRMGQVNISGGTINAITTSIGMPTDTVNGKPAYAYSGNVWFPDALYVIGGTYTSTDATYGNSLKMNITGGTFNCTNGKGSAVAIYDLGKVAQTANVTISGDAKFATNSAERNAYQVVSFADMGAEPIDGFGKTELVGKVSTTITGGLFSSDPSTYVADGHYVDASNNGDYPYTVKVGTKPAGALIVVKDATDVTVPDSEAIKGLTTEDKTNISQNTKVDGVAEAVAAKKTDLIPKSVDTSAATKVEVEVSVKVEVKSADLSGENAAKTLTFEAKPVATIKVDGTVKATDVAVPNSLLSGAITVKLPLPAGFTPEQIKHISSDGSVEYFLKTEKRGAKLFTVDSDNCAVFTITKFSTFELSGTVTYVEPSYYSGSSSYDPTYSVSTPSKTEHGSVTVSPKSASKGDRVTVTVKPDSGYVLETLTVTDKNGNELTLKDKGDGKYTFTMPAGKVEVKATFMEDNSMLNFFYDVPNNAYFYEAVKWAVKNGITTGVGNDLFAPEQPCTRAQIVTFLWRAAGSPEPKGAASGMTDVVSGSYYEKAVAWAIENGITTGTTTTTFSPDATCTRAQAVTFLARALKAKAASAAEFSDVPNDSYFADAVAWAAANGVTEGIGGGLFGSDNDCTRGQIVTFLYRAYNK